VVASTYTTDGMVASSTTSNQGRLHCAGGQLPLLMFHPRQS
jgi:hypothetical protein